MKLISASMVPGLVNNQRELIATAVIEHEVGRWPFKRIERFTAVSHDMMITWHPQGQMNKWYAGTMNLEIRKVFREWYDKQEFLFFLPK